MYTVITSVPIIIWGILSLIFSLYIIYKVYVNKNKDYIFFKVCIIIAFVSLSMVGIFLKYYTNVSKIIFFYISIPFLVISFILGPIYLLFESYFLKKKDNF